MAWVLVFALAITMVPLNASTVYASGDDAPGTEEQLPESGEPSEPEGGDPGDDPGEPGGDEPEPTPPEDPEEPPIEEPEEEDEEEIIEMMGLLEPMSSGLDMLDFSWFSGPGEETYQIATADQLAALAFIVNGGPDLPLGISQYSFEDQVIRLTNDINLGAYGELWNEGRGWIPIGDGGTVDAVFKGYFDGARTRSGGRITARYDITGLYIDDTITGRRQYNGLFGYIDGGVVEGLRIVNADIKANADGTAYVGGVAGLVEGSGALVDWNVVTGSVSYTGTSDEARVGGLVGEVRSSNATVNAGISEAAVSGRQYVGGVAGFVGSSGRADHSYSTGMVIGTGNNVGGIAGMVSGGRVFSTWSISAVRGLSNVGGIVGQAASGATVERSAALNTSVLSVTNADTVVGRVAGASSGALSNNIGFSGMDLRHGVDATTYTGGTTKIPGATASETGVDGASRNATSLQVVGGFPAQFIQYPWGYAYGALPGIGLNVSYPMPSHLIPTSGEPNNLWYYQNPNASVFTISTAADLAGLAELVNDEGIAFAGRTLNLIDNIDLTLYGAAWNGGRGWSPIGISTTNMFRGVFNGNTYTVTGLYINDITAPQRAYNGLFGYVGTGGAVRNLNVQGASVVSNNAGASYLGIIAGFITGAGSQIEGGSVTGSIAYTGASDDARVGGVVGMAQSGTAIENVSSAATVSGRSGVGGVAGELSAATVSGSSSTGAVSATSAGAGTGVGGVAGIVGGSGSRVESSYSTGAVTSIGSQVGGVAGNVTGPNAVISGSSATGNVGGAAQVGGAVGHVGAGGKVEYSYSMGAVTGTGNGVGGVAGFIVGGGAAGEANNGAAIGNWSTSSVQGADYAGGVAGQLGSANAIVRQNAALNPSVARTAGGTGNLGRVAGSAGALTDNIAYADMQISKAVAPSPTGVDGTSRGGASVQILAAFPSWTEGGIPVGFGISPWTYEAGSLPGHGAAVPMPPHLAITAGKPNAIWYGRNPSLTTFTIATADELAGLAEIVSDGLVDFDGQTVILASDISLGSYGSGWNAGKGWLPIGTGEHPFAGTLNGGGYTITGLYINDASAPQRECNGLFGHITGGRVVDLRVEGANITFSSAVAPAVSCAGIIAGVIEGAGAYIEWSFVTGTVSYAGTNDNVRIGGIAGQVQAGASLTEVGSAATVNGRQYAGGVAGYVTGGGSVDNAYATGNVTGAGSNVGGIVGYIDGGVVVAAWASGTITGADRVGGVAGQVGTGGSVSSSAALNQGVVATAANPANFGRVAGNATGLSGNIAFDAMTYSKQTFTPGDATIEGASRGRGALQGAGGFPEPLVTFPWTYSTGSLPGLGTAMPMPAHLGLLPGTPDSQWYYQNPTASGYTITTADQLAGLAEIVNSGETDFSGKVITLAANIELHIYGASWNGGKGWIPIGLDADTPFSGTFNGSLRTIAGLFINDTSTGQRLYNGLFGYVNNGAVIQGVRLENANIRANAPGGDSYVGGVAGYIVDSGTQIENSTVTGLVSYTGTNANARVGGITGEMQDSSIVTGSRVTATVEGVGYVGGIAGRVRTNSAIRESHTTGNVTGTGAYVGGITGRIGLISATAGVATETGIVEDCYSTGYIRSDGDYVGGIAGSVNGSGGNAPLRRSYSTGAVRGANNVGGVAGRVETNNTIVDDCYSMGDIIATGTRAGGVVGWLYGLTQNNTGLTLNGQVRRSWASGSVQANDYVGGIVGDISGNGMVVDCAALNRSVIKRNNAVANLGRVVGSAPATQGPGGNAARISGNIAFEDMDIRYNGTAGAPKTPASGLTEVDGLNRGKGDLKEASGFTTSNSWFTSREANPGSPWYYLPEALPGLGAPVMPMPAHLVGDGPRTLWYYLDPSADVFTITNADELAGLAKLVNEGIDFDGKTIDLVANIDLSYYATTNASWEDGRGWTPIGGANFADAAANPFRGTFEGNGHTISELSIDDDRTATATTRRRHGLFGYISGGASVRNLNVQGTSITWAPNFPGRIGMVVALAEGAGTVIEGCSATGTITYTIAANTTTRTGGIVGSLDTGAEARNVWSGVDITGRQQVGGVAGYVDNGSAVISSWASGTMQGALNVGGVVGQVATGGSVTGNAALNISVFKTGAGVAGVGRVSGTGSAAELSENIAWSAMNIRVGATSATTGTIKTPLAPTYTGLDGQSMDVLILHTPLAFPAGFGQAPWVYEMGMLPGLGAGVAMPTHLAYSGYDPSKFTWLGTDPSATSFSITTAVELAEFAELVNGGFPFIGLTVNLANPISLSAYGSGKGWTPIGTSAAASFQGTFNGTGHAITGLYINDVGSAQRDYNGLFGYINNNAIVRNVKVENATITFDAAGANARGGIVVAVADVSSIIENSQVVDSTISYTGTSTTSGYTGGLVGEVRAGSVVRNSFSTGEVNGRNNVGGVVGYINGAGSRVYNTWSIATVSGAQGVGGLAGAIAAGAGGVADSAALNESVTATANGAANVGRVTTNAVGLFGNVAFADMDIFHNATTPKPTTSSETGVDGADRTGQVLQGPGAFPGALRQPPWVYTAGSLPGLGEPFPMPDHIIAEDDPAILTIATAAELATFAASVNGGDSFLNRQVILAADIDLGSYPNWTPIGLNGTTPFRGIFDGNGRTVTGLTINATTQHAGLFGYIGDNGYVHDLVIENANVALTYTGAGDSYVGILAGYVNAARIEDISVSGTVSTTTATAHIGGIVGHMQGTGVTLARGVSEAAVSGVANVGGIAGYVNAANATIENSYSTGAVMGTGTNVGGIVGYIAGTTARVNNSWSISYVRGNDYVGGIVGRVDAGGGVANSAALNPAVLKIADAAANHGRVAGNNVGLSNNIAFVGMQARYNNTNAADPTVGTPRTITNNAANTDGANRTSENLREGGQYPAQLTQHPWTYAAGFLPGLNGVPYEMPAHIRSQPGQPDLWWYNKNPDATVFEIWTADELAGLSQLVNGTPAINFSGRTINLMDDISLYDYRYDATPNTFFGAKGWNPIGVLAAAPFRGVFDGGGFTISQMTINDNANYRAHNGLFGYIGTGGKVQNLSLTGVYIVSNATAATQMSAGVIAGVVNGVGASITDCHAEGEIYLSVSTNQTNPRVGGIVGQVQAAATVVDCTSDVIVRGGRYLGGIAGQVMGQNSAIRGSTATGPVTGNTNIGGVAGWLNNGVIENSQATGTVTSTQAAAAANYVGGIAGLVDAGGRVETSFFSGVVTALGDDIGGVAGRVTGAGSTIRSSGSTGNVTGRSNIGGVVGYVAAVVVQNSYSTGRVMGSGTAVGGVAGQINGAAARVNNSWSTSYVRGENNVGGIVGNNAQGGVTNSAALNSDVLRITNTNSGYGRVVGLQGGTNLSGNVAFGGMNIRYGNTNPNVDNPLFGTPKTITTTATMTQVDGETRNKGALQWGPAYPGVLRQVPWIYEPGYLPGIVEPIEMPAHLMLSPGDPDDGWYYQSPTSNSFMIYTADELAGLAVLVNGSPAINFSGRTVTLMADIDLSDYGLGASAWNGGRGWIPIGRNANDANAVSATNRFQGTFNGNNKIVAGLYINDTATGQRQYNGLFGYVTGGGRVRNLRVEDASITFNHAGTAQQPAYGGIIAAWLDGAGSMIDGCYVSGTINYSAATNNVRVGGVVGYVGANGSIENSVSEADVNGRNYVGGIAGIITGTNATIRGSRVTGTVSGAISDVGGIVGRIDTGGSVESCYFSGTVSGAANDVGGIVGRITGAGTSVQSSASSGDVSGAANVGGVAGYVNTPAIVRNVYSTGDVTGTGASVGGVAGQLNGATARVENSWSISRVQGANNVGGIAGQLATNAGVVNSAALNEFIIKTTATEANLGRVVGNISGTATTGNVGFAEANVTHGGTQKNIVSGGTLADGEDRSRTTLQGASGFPSQLRQSPWVYAIGFLPGHGEAYPMPEHLMLFEGMPDSRWYHQNPNASRFIISTADELAGLAELVNGTPSITFLGKTISLIADINLSSYGLGASSWNSGRGWIPIGTNTPVAARFQGTFEGNENVITGLYIDSTGAGQRAYNGLFGYVSGGGRIHDLTVRNANITFNAGGTSYGGGIAGYIEGAGSAIEGGGASGAISYTGTSADARVGGLAGQIGVGVAITGSRSSAVVSGNSNVGGVAGYVTGTNARILNTRATGASSGTGSYIGGIAGYVGAGGRVETSNASGAVSGGSDVGGVAGYVTGGSSAVRTSYFTGTASGAGRIGGIAGGIADGAVIENTWVDGSVAATASDAGGVVGNVTGTGSRVSNSWATGGIQGTSYVGGIAGQVGAGGSVTNSAALNTNVNSTSGSALIGRVAGNATGLTNNIGFSLMDISKVTLDPNESGADGVSRSRPQLQESSAFPLQLRINPWVYAAGLLPGLGEPYSPMPEHLRIVPGEPNDQWYYQNTNAPSYIIRTPEELAGLAMLVNDGVFGFTGRTIFLGADINLSIYGSGAAWNDGKGWIPIGTAANPFSGTFAGSLSGNEYTITNLFINADTGAYNGLFGHIADGRVQNLKVEGANITHNVTGTTYAGIIAGLVTGPTAAITGSSASGVITFGNNANARVGGIVGQLQGGAAITNTSSAATVGGANLNNGGGIAGFVTGSGTVISGSDSSGAISGVTGIGGIAGRVEAGALIENCNPTGSVTGTGAGAANTVGGIVGIITGSGSAVRGSFTKIPVTGINNVGGVAGRIEAGASVEDSYSMGAVNGTGSSIGGVAGLVTGAGSSVKHTWSASSVQGNTFVGGIVGQVAAGGSVTDNVALNERVFIASGATSIGRVSGNGTGLANNGAFADMDINTVVVPGAALPDGLSRTAASLRNGTAFPEHFRTNAPWAYMPDYLPGLRNDIVVPPDYLGLSYEITLEVYKDGDLWPDHNRDLKLVQTFNEGLIVIIELLEGVDIMTAAVPGGSWTVYEGDYNTGLVIEDDGTIELHYHTATLSVKRDGMPWADHGKDFELRMSGYESIMRAGMTDAAAGTVEAGVLNGTWKVYVGGAYSGIDIVINDDVGSAEIDFQTASLNVNLDGNPWDGHGKSFTLKLSGDESVVWPMVGTGSTVSAGVDGGIWKVYEGSVYTGIDIDTDNPPGSADIDYFTIGFSLTAEAGVTGSISATYGGAPISSGAVVLSGGVLVITATASSATADGFRYVWHDAIEDEPINGDVGFANRHTRVVETTVGITCTVRGVIAPIITTSSLPNATVGEAYSELLAATGDEPIEWSLVVSPQFPIPAGLEISEDGEIFGVPIQNGRFTFTVAAENEGGKSTRGVTITVESAAISGTVEITGDAIYGETLTAVPDNIVGTLSYTWMIANGGGFADTPITTTSVPTYQINVDTAIGHGIYVIVSSDVSQGTVRSAATAPVARRTSPQTPDAPTMASRTVGSIVLNTIQYAEYRIYTGAGMNDDDDWQDSASFMNLAPNTAYLFQARIKETAVQDGSPISAVSEPIYTDRALLTGQVTVTGSFVYGEGLTAATAGLGTLPAGLPLGDPSYEWRSYATLTGGTFQIIHSGAADAGGAEYELQAADVGRYITVAVTTSETSGVRETTPRQLVAPRTLTITQGGYGVTKVYDGTNSPGTGSGTLGGLDGVINNDDISIVAVPGNYTGVDVGSAYTVTATISLEGTPATAYVPASPTLTITGASITQLDLTVERGTYTVTKEYDSDTTPGTGNAALLIVDTIVPADVGIVTVADEPAAFTSAAVGNYTINVGISLAGNPVKVANYNLLTTTLTGVPASITTKSVTVTQGGYNVSKVYDGTNDAGTGAGLLGITGIEDVTVTVVPTPRDFGTSNVGSTHTVTIDLALDGAGSGNYSLTNDTITLTNASITQRPVTVLVGDFEVRKEFDGTVSAGTGDEALLDVAQDAGVGIVQTDESYVWVSAAADSYPSLNSGNVGSYTVNVTLSLAGDSARIANYDLQTLTLTGVPAFIDTAKLDVEHTVHVQYDDVRDYTESLADLLLDYAISSDTPLFGTVAVVDSYNILAGVPVVSGGNLTFGIANNLDDTYTGREAVITIPVSGLHNYHGAEIHVIVAVTDSAPPVIMTESLPDAAVGAPYNVTGVLLDAIGTKPITWSLVSGTGSLPDGLILNPSTGIISGTPTMQAAGTFSFTVRATNQYGDPVQSGSHDMPLSIELSIAKLSGDITIGGFTDAPQYGDTLTVQGTAALTSDIAGVNIGSLSYQWYRNGTAIAGETGATYTLGPDDIDALITVDVRSANTDPDYPRLSPAVGPVSGKQLLSTDIVGSVSAAGRTYNGNADATGLALADIVSGLEIEDEGKVFIIVNEAVFDNRNVGNGKTITITDWELDGDASGGYALPALPFTHTGLSANITQATLTSIDVTATSRAYNGDVDVVVNIAPLTADNGVMSNTAGTLDDVTLDLVDAEFADPNVANGISIIYSWELGGTDAGNYEPPDVTNYPRTANITRAPLPTLQNIPKTVQYDDHGQQEVTDAELAAIVAAHLAAGDTPVFTLGTITGINASLIASHAYTGGRLTFSIDTTLSSADSGRSVTIPMNVTGFRNYENGIVNVVVTIADDAPPTIIIENNNLQSGTVGLVYAPVELQARGTRPITWSQSSGNFPPGLVLRSDGTIDGTPTTAGEFIFTVLAENEYSGGAGYDFGDFRIVVGRANLNGTPVVSGYTGSPQYGDELTVTGTFTPSVAGVNIGTVTYQWHRGGVEITGATGTTYTVTGDDIGSTIHVTVTAENTNGTLTSAPTLAATPRAVSVTQGDDYTLTKPFDGDATATTDHEVGAPVATGLLSADIYNEVNNTGGVRVVTAPVSFSGSNVGTHTALVNLSLDGNGEGLYRLGAMAGGVFTPQTSLTVTGATITAGTLELDETADTHYEAERNPSERPRTIDLAQLFAISDYAVSGDNPVYVLVPDGIDDPQNILASGTAVSSVGVLSFDVASGLTASSIGDTADIAVAVTGLNNHSAVTLTLTIRLVDDAPPYIVTSSLPAGIVGAPYDSTGVQLVATGTRPITWGVSSGALPVGLSLDAATGLISGTPTSQTAGPYTFTIMATGRAGTPQAATHTRSFTIDISASALEGEISIDGDAVYGGILTIVEDVPVGPADPGVVPGTITYTWYRGGVAISGATGATYTLGAEDIDSAIHVVITAANCTGSVAASAVGPVARRQLAPTDISVSIEPSKVYDGDIDATSMVEATIATGLLTDDIGNVTIEIIEAEFANANAGADKPVTIVEWELDGSAADCYILPSLTDANAHFGLSAEIEKATVAPIEHGPIEIHYQDSGTRQLVALASLVSEYAATGGTAAYAPGAPTGDPVIVVTGPVPQPPSMTNTSDLRFNIIAGLVEPDNIGNTATIPVTVSGFTNYENIAINVVVEIVDRAPAAITTTSPLPAAWVGADYEVQLEATGTQPITWNHIGGNLPPGFSLGSDGNVSGAPVPGTSMPPYTWTYAFNVSAYNIYNTLPSMTSFTIAVSMAALAGAITIEHGRSGAPQYGDELGIGGLDALRAVASPGGQTIPGVDLTDRAYQWYRGGVAIPGATGTTYTLTGDDIG
ncbi:MAG: YDG domain-containing protein, partial [Clostridiales bacterium]|nr:YDG domain-containing protein [Clostridiales bacterium]